MQLAGDEFRVSAPKSAYLNLKVGLSCLHLSILILLWKTCVSETAYIRSRMLEGWGVKVLKNVHCFY